MYDYRPNTSSLKICYVFYIFPSLSETFVINEILAFASRCVDGKRFPLALKRDEELRPA